MMLYQRIELAPLGWRHFDHRTIADNSGLRLTEDLFLDTPLSPATAQIGHIPRRS
jgi:hypothetical protein